MVLAVVVLVVMVVVDGAAVAIVAVAATMHVCLANDQLQAASAVVHSVHVLCLEQSAAVPFDRGAAVSWTGFGVSTHTAVPQHAIVIYNYRDAN